MERLTKRDEYSNADIIGVDIANWQLSLTFDECNLVTKALNKLAKYEDLEEQGLLLKLPYKVGDTVYIVGDRFPAVIEAIRIGEDNHIMFEFVEYDKSPEITEVWDSGGFELEDIGKTVFLTREEAAQKLKELGE